MLAWYDEPVMEALCARALQLSSQFNIPQASFVAPMLCEPCFPEITQGLASLLTGGASNHSEVQLCRSSSLSLLQALPCLSEAPVQFFVFLQLLEKASVLSEWLYQWQENASLSQKHVGLSTSTPVSGLEDDFQIMMSQTWPQKSIKQLSCLILKKSYYMSC